MLLRKNVQIEERLHFAYCVGLFEYLMPGILGSHHGIMNAFFCCEYYDKGIDSLRYIQIDRKRSNSHYGSYLSCMANAKRNPPEELRNFLSTGWFRQRYYGKPNLEKFKKLTKSNWRMDEKDAIYYRRCMMECFELECSLKEQGKSHLQQHEFEEIEAALYNNALYNDDDENSGYQTLVFTLIKVTMMIDGNDYNRTSSTRSKKIKTVNEAAYAVDNMSPGMLLLHTFDD